MFAPEVPTASVVAAPAGGVASPNTLVAGAAQTDIGFFYNNGPLAAGITLNNQDALAVGSTVAPAGTTGLRETQLFVQYAFGPARVFFGAHNEDVLTAAGGSINDSGTNLGVRYDISNITLLANFDVKRNAAAGTDQRMWGLGLDYNFSKRTAALVRINQQNNDGVAAAATAETRNLMVGLIHKF